MGLKHDPVKYETRRLTGPRARKERPMKIQRTDRATLRNEFAMSNRALDAYEAGYGYDWIPRRFLIQIAIKVQKYATPSLFIAADYKWAVVSGY